MRQWITAKLKGCAAFFIENRLLIFFIAAISYLELIYRLWNFRNISPDYIFPVLFALSAGAVLFLISRLFKPGINWVVTIILTLVLTLVYGVQLVYYCIFRTPLSIYSLTGAGDVLQFRDIIITAIAKNIIGVTLLFIPLAFLIVFSKRISFSRIKLASLYIALAFWAASYTISIICVNLTGDGALSHYTLYYKTSSPELSVSKLGLMTTMRLDFERLVFKFGQNTVEAAAVDDEYMGDYEETSVFNSVYGVEEANSGEEPVKVNGPVEVSEPEKAELSPFDIYNIMDIDFEALIASEKDPNLLGMHKYFSSVNPTKKNQYTGMFRGNNLILITAESFSPYAISKELTPTLYEMSRSGFVFTEFYNPIWGVSTSDGEYVACTGLIPKSGVWSLARSGKNYMPFTMGNQFKSLGYTTKAYHDHSYTYYKRNISHPNLGYDYKAVGNGLNVKKTWPESDLEMINVTAGEFIGQQPFHIYYMTVSGHMNYNFYGNYIAKKNKPLVDSLPYSDEAKAYIAGNLELEFAMKALIDKLEEAGIADKTVIAISPDHYPYGLQKKSIDELAGHEVESNFELYKSTFILWKKGMKPVVIDKPCSSLDIIPTLSNLFGLEYDSRLLMGRDILSDAPPLVMFSNRSWITEKARYNAATNTAVYFNGNKDDPGYAENINKLVDDKFKYSAKILETDYYGKIIKKN